MLFASWESMRNGSWDVVKVGSYRTVVAPLRETQGHISNDIGLVQSNNFWLKIPREGRVFQSDGRKDFWVAFLCYYLEGSHFPRPYSGQISALAIP